MPSRVFQGVVQQMKDSVNRNMGVIDSGAVVIASADLALMGKTLSINFE